MDSVRPSHSRCPLVIMLVIISVTNLGLSALQIKETFAQTTHEVKITDFAFVPQNLAISLGDTVTWNNTDPVIHTLWFVFITNQSTYLLSDPILPGAIWTHTFNDAAELQYYSFDRLWITGFVSITAGVHDVAVTNIQAQPIIVRGDTSWHAGVNVTVFNEGDFPETFRVTAYAFNATHELEIETQTVSDLAPSTQTVLNFFWGTAGFDYGNYTIKAYAVPVLGETHFADNTLIDGEVLISKPGDLNLDGEVNYKDASLFRQTYIGAYNYMADLNFDGLINYRDANLFRYYYIFDP